MNIKKAFTMIELVLIIVVVGILAATIIPRTDRNTALEAANQVVSHIRYTQHLAMLDNKFNHTNANWANNRWRITFNANSYSITSGAAATATANMTAQDPQRPGKSLNPTDSPNLNLAEKYGMTISDQVIIFDEKGRPYDNNGLLGANIQLELKDGDKTALITIHQETGYVELPPF